MKGARPLTVSEIKLVSTKFKGSFAVRNKSLFMLAISCGGRISEMLSLTVGDVWQHGQPISDLLFRKQVVKGQEESRMVPINEDGRQAISDLIVWHRDKYGDVDPDRMLFTSRQGGGFVALSRGQAHNILREAFHQAGLNGKVATHSLRKSFAQRFYDVTGDIYMVKELLGHKNVVTTQEYLGVSYSKLKKGCDQISVSRLNTSPVLYNSLAEIETDTMILELGRRGCNIDALLEEPHRTDNILCNELDNHVSTFDHLGSLVAKNALESSLSHRLGSG